MDARRLAPTLGIVTSLAFLLVLGVPFLLIDNGVGTYYAQAALNPLFAGLFALVGVIVFAAGREERTDPPIAAGAAVVFGLAIVAFALVWALTVPASLVLSLTDLSVFEYHRYLVVLVALTVLASAGWYARTLRLV